MFRIEFPILPKYKELFDELINRRENGIIYLADILKASMNKLDNYTVKRKAFFNEEYKGKIAFARFEKHTDLSSKGHGIKIWLSEKKLDNPTVIHVGDQDRPCERDADGNLLAMFLDDHGPARKPLQASDELPLYHTQADQLGTTSALRYLNNYQSTSFSNLVQRNGNGFHVWD